MELYKVKITAQADENLEAIYPSSADRWSFSETHSYVLAIRNLCFELDQIPHRFSFDEHTKYHRMFRSFEHGSHKVFFTVNEDTKTVDVVTILPSRSNYKTEL